MPEKILVVGGSGFIGSHIVQELWKAGRPVVILSRNPGDARSKLHGIEVDYVRGDVREPRSLVKALKDVTHVISCAQFPNHPVEDPAKGYTYEKVDGEGTRNLVAAAAEAGGVQRFVYLSGAGVRENRPHLEREPWFRGKLMAEHAIRASKIPYTIIRPSWVYGREDRSLNRFVSFARLLPAVPVIGDGRNRVQPLFILDLARFIVEALADERAANKIYELGGPETLTMDEVVLTILRVLHKSKRILHQPAWFMKLAARPMKFLPKPPLSPGAVDFITMDELVDNSQAERDFHPRLTRLEDALSSYLRQ